MNISDGTVSELTLDAMSNGYSKPLRILCDAGDFLLVQYDTYTGTIQSVYEGQRTEMLMPEAPRLGLISLTDFLSNSPNYIPVTDQVIAG